MIARIIYIYSKIILTNILFTIYKKIGTRKYFSNYLNFKLVFFVMIGSTAKLIFEDIFNPLKGKIRNSTWFLKA